MIRLRLQFLETGDRTEDVDFNILFLMADQANATHLQMQTRRAPAAPHMDFAETLMITANAMDALTSGIMVSTLNICYNAKWL